MTEVAYPESTRREGQMIGMKPAQLLSSVILLFCVPIASAQDCKPDGSASFAQLKNSTSGDSQPITGILVGTRGTGIDLAIWHLSRLCNPCQIIRWPHRKLSERYC